MRRVDKSNYDTKGGLEILEIIRAMGFETDYSAASALKYFLRSPFFGKEEEDLRACLFHLELIYARESVGPAIHKKKINIGWFEDPRWIASLEKIIHCWDLEGLRREFIESLHFTCGNLERCIRIVDAMINLCSDYSDAFER